MDPWALEGVSLLSRSLSSWPLLPCFYTSRQLRANIGQGTIAAGIQSALYGGFTPAGGLFAGLQSAGMTGALLPMAAGVAGGAALIVLGVGFFKWFRGREGHDEDGHQHED